MMALRAVENLKPGDQLRDAWDGKLWTVAGMAVLNPSDGIVVSLCRDIGEKLEIELRYGDLVQIANVM